MSKAWKRKYCKDGCEFYEGVCRRFPPQIIIQTNGYKRVQYPDVREKKACAEYKGNK